MRSMEAYPRAAMERAMRVQDVRNTHEQISIARGASDGRPKINFGDHCKSLRRLC